MRRRAFRAAAALAVLVAAASPTLAEPPRASGGPSAGPSGRPPTEQLRDRLLEELRQRLPVPSSSSPLPKPSGSAFAPTLPASSALAERFRQLAESRHQRRERNRAELVRQLGQRLADPRVKDELRVHATRVAELARLKFLAEQTRSGARRSKLLERIERLSAQEARRHEQALDRLRREKGAASAAPAPSQVPR